MKYSDSANCAQGIDNLFVLTVYQLYKGPYSYLFAISLFYQQYASVVIAGHVLSSVTSGMDVSSLYSVALGFLASNLRNNCYSFKPII